MPNLKMTELAQAYAATTYRIYLPEGALNLRVDQPSPALQSWLADEGVAEFAIITACNPGSQPRRQAENAEAQARLACDLLEAGYACLPAENQPDGDWPLEESYFIPGMQREEACAIAEDYGQLAIIHGDGSGIAGIVWTALAASGNFDAD